MILIKTTVVAVCIFLYARKLDATFALKQEQAAARLAQSLIAKIRNM